MKKGLIIFLKAVIVLIGIVVLIVMIRFPLTEGRAVNLDLVSIYSDPLIIYGYVASIAFFIALYQAFKLLGYIEQNKTSSLSSIKTLRTIKYCAITLSISIVMALIYIRIFHGKDDDPAGAIAVGVLVTFIFIVIAIAAAMFEKLLQKVGKYKF